MFFRTILLLFAAVIAITFLRAIIGFVGKAVAQLFDPVPRRQAQPNQPKASGASAAELVQCPGCGIYVSTETRLRKTVDGKLRHFCSEDCQKKV
jgi:hypothetical protein